MLIREIPIIFITDEKYVMPTIVAIYSLKMNKEEGEKYIIFILADSLSIDSINAFNSLWSNDFQIEILKPIADYQFLSIKNLSIHVSRAALLKFQIAEVLHNYDKVIYLDCDIIIKHSLADLYNIELGDYYAAVIKDYKPMTYKPTQLEKLGINSDAYFNSGVMLLNLKKMREEKTHQRLIEYRINMKNDFMDQDAFNAVFGSDVIYISFLFNVILSNIGFFSINELTDYYSLSKGYLCKQDIINDATIIHFSTKYKPWIYCNVPLFELWKEYYNLTGLPELDWSLLSRNEYKAIFPKCSVELLEYSTPSDLLIKEQVVISLTSYPKRIDSVSNVIESLLQQSIRADKIILWLARDEFDGLDSLPTQLKIYHEQGKIEIEWCDNLCPHKKYFFAMKKYTDSIIITVDDDIEYDNQIIEDLLISYRLYPNAVSANRAHLMKFDQCGKFSNYSEWEYEYDVPGVPSLALFATGCGGVLYPPNIFPAEMFDLDRIVRDCLFADDVWLKAFELQSMIPVVVARQKKDLKLIENSQDCALWKTNVDNNMNDVYIDNLSDIFYRDKEKIELMKLSSTLVASINERQIKSLNSKVGGGQYINIKVCLEK